MNVLLSSMKQSLAELDLGLKGDLTMSEPMEKLMSALANDTVRPAADCPGCQLWGFAVQLVIVAALVLLMVSVELGVSGKAAAARCLSGQGVPAQVWCHAPAGAGLLGQPGLPQPEATGVLAAQPAAACHAAGRVDSRPGRAQVCLAVRAVQPPVLPHRRHAGGLCRCATCTAAHLPCKLAVLQVQWLLCWCWGGEQGCPCRS